MVALASLVIKKLLANAGDVRDVGSIPGLGGSPEGGQHTLVFLPRESHGQRSLACYTVHGVAKSQTQSEQVSTAQRQFGAKTDLVLRNDTRLYPTCWKGSHCSLVSMLTSSR